MKKIAIAALICAFAQPAFAAKMSVKFERDDGTVTNAEFDSSTMMVTSGDAEATPYTWDAETGVLCVEAMSVCVTLEGVSDERKVGDSADYSTDEGHKGTATITAME